MGAWVQSRVAAKTSRVQGRKDDTFTGAEGPYVDLLPVLLRYGPQVVVLVELGVEVNLHLGAPQGGEVLPNIGLADVARAAGAAR